MLILKVCGNISSFKTEICKKSHHTYHIRTKSLIFYFSSRGDKVSILYDPGLFPCKLYLNCPLNINGCSFGDIFSVIYIFFAVEFPGIYENGTFRNGGVPQQSDLKAHLEKFQLDVDKQIPDKENSGIAIIDFELWRPVYRQNFGKFQPYKDTSVKLVKDANPLLTKQEVDNEANRIFTEFAKTFMTETIESGKLLRPNAKVFNK